MNQLHSMKLKVSFTRSVFLFFNSRVMIWTEFIRRVSVLVEVWFEFSIAQINNRLILLYCRFNYILSKVKMHSYRGSIVSLLLKWWVGWSTKVPCFVLLLVHLIRVLMTCLDEVETYNTHSHVAPTVIRYFYPMSLYIPSVWRYPYW